MFCNKKKMCSVCLEDFPSSKVSYCVFCMESGNTCHGCEEQWARRNHNPIECTICKQFTKKNVKYEVYITPYRNSRCKLSLIHKIACTVLIILFCLLIIMAILFVIVYTLYYIFS